MRSDSPSPLKMLQLIKPITETVASVLSWIVELIRRRNWFMLLVVLGVVLAFVGHFGKDALDQVLAQEMQPLFWWTFWVGVALIFMVAVGVAIVTLPQLTPSKADLAERRAIKGLRPFRFEDAEIFAQLQRGQLMRDCVDVLTTTPFRFGVLMGESGCGKTSFLQAGGWPQLMAPSSSHCGVYVRFSDQEPLATVQKALATQLELPAPWQNASPPLDHDIETTTTWFLALLTQAVVAAGKPIVLLLDQFEQWFVHAQQVSDRAPFLQGLRAWYCQPDIPDVKILVSIRSDMVYHLHALHQTLGYALGPQEVFNLEKFLPAEATRVLAAIAQSEQLRFEERFVAELAEQELADREDGRISPVDVQILAWMIDRQNVTELRAFDRQAFQRFGGVEGLLTPLFGPSVDGASDTGTAANSGEGVARPDGFGSASAGGGVDAGGPPGEGGGDNTAHRSDHQAEP